MKVQKSFDTTEGVLYVVGTPIGNLGDISPRAIEVLRSVDLIAAEDTRHTRKLLRAFNILKPLTSYHQFSRNKKEEQLIGRLQSGQTIAVVSDAGMPGISDPGEKLVHHAIQEGISVVPISGPTAAISALVASGLPTQPFLFVGFLSRVSKKRKEELRKWSEVEATLIFYEAPYRLLEMLYDVLEVCGDRHMVISREISKVHEEWLRGSVKECISYLEEHGSKGEFTIVLAPSERTVAKKKWDDTVVFEEITKYTHKGISKKEAIQKVAVELQLPKNEVYQKYHRSIKKE